MIQMNASITEYGTFPSLKLVSLSAFGRNVAIEKSKVLQVGQVQYDHCIVRHNRGLLMTYLNEVIPIVDCRSDIKNVPGAGATVVVASINGKNFAMLVDEELGEINFSYSEQFISGEQGLDNPAIVGCVLRDGRPIFILDLALVFGATVIATATR